MARKLPPGSFHARPAELTARDACAGVFGAGLALALSLWLLPLEAWAPHTAAWWAGVAAVAAYAAYGWGSVALSRVDVRDRLLPNAMVLWLSVVVVGLCVVASLLRAKPEGIGWAALWAAVSGLAALGIWALPASPLGGGDVKLVPVTLFAALWGADAQTALGGVLVLGGVAALLWLFAGLNALVRRRREIAAAPLLFLASWVAFTVTRLPEQIG